MTDINSKVILITGASSGIGKATAIRLLNEGDTVYATARSVDKMQDLEEMGAHVLKVDITKYETAEAAVNQLIEEQGRIDVLFNNAGFGLYGPIEDVSIDEAKYQFDVLLFGLANITKMVLPIMRQQGSGTIINTSSMGGKIYTPLGAWYHAGKHALEGWSDCLRLEVKQFGIKVVILEPGIIQTSFGDVMNAKTAEIQESSNGGSPYNDLIEQVKNTSAESYNGGATPPDEIAKVVSKIINTKNPKPRYVKGKFAKPLIWARKWLGDRLYDRIIMSQV